MKKAIEEILAHYGDILADPSLKDTPKRYEKVLEELLGASKQDAPELKTFPCMAGQSLIFCSELEAVTLCPHHLLPYYITAHFAYIPDRVVVGISKPGRLLKWVCGRLILQEAIAESFFAEFKKQVPNKGMALLIEGHHLCSSIRGVKQANNKTITFTSKLTSTEETRFWACVNLGRSSL